MRVSLDCKLLYRSAVVPSLLSSEDGGRHTQDQWYKQSTTKPNNSLKWVLRNLETPSNKAELSKMLKTPS